MELIQIAAKVAFTMVLLSWFFISMCKFASKEPSDLVKGMTVFIFIAGLVIGIITIICFAWSI
jgi:hypothetical protein